jgi:hypothetical protein
VNGYEITQALKAILAESDTTIEAGLTWLHPAESERLTRLLNRMTDRSKTVRLADIGLPHPANRKEGGNG